MKNLNDYVLIDDLTRDELFDILGDYFYTVMTLHYKDDNDIDVDEQLSLKKYNVSDFSDDILKEHIKQLTDFEFYEKNDVHKIQYWFLKKMAQLHRDHNDNN